MGLNEMMYDQSSIVIAAVLFLLIMIAYELGYRLGTWNQEHTTPELKDQTNAIQAGVLGILALLLGFTFNMALQRFDDRSEAVVNEANAIGTALLRTQLLPAPFADEMGRNMRAYIDQRIAISTVELTDLGERGAIDVRTDSIIHMTWELAVRAAAVDPHSLSTSSFIVALNEAIDARGERNAILTRHVPEVILYILFIVFITSGALVGFSSGLSMKRAYTPTALMSLLIVLVVFIIIDLDRPKRGIIKVQQDSLLELQGQ